MNLKQISILMALNQLCLIASVSHPLELNQFKEEKIGYDYVQLYYLMRGGIPLPFRI